MDGVTNIGGLVGTGIESSQERVMDGGNGIPGRNSISDPQQSAASGANNQSSGNGENAVLSPVEISEANAELVEHMRRVLENSLYAASQLQIKLTHTYWVVTVLSTVMFIVGMALISTPLWAPLANSLIDGEGPYDWQTILTTVGIGVADLIALFLFGPINRIQRLMGDFSQLIISLETYQVQVAIRLLEADSNVRESVGRASEHVGRLTKEILKLIETYYDVELETEENSQKSTTVQVNRQ